MAVELRLRRDMDFRQTTSTSVLLQSPSEPTAVEARHPTKRCLSRFVLDEMGARRKKTIILRIENCSACKQEADRLRQMRRTFRDLEKNCNRTRKIRVRFGQQRQVQTPPPRPVRPTDSCAAPRRALRCSATTSAIAPAWPDC